MRYLCLIAILLVTAGCDSNLGYGELLDSSTDTSVEPDVDSTEDAAAEELPDCSYPPGAYAFSSLGDHVRPMSWPDAIARADEGDAPADLHDFFCDPDIHSVFIHLSTTVCPYCPDRMREIAYRKEQWEALGAKWIFVVSDAGTQSRADEFTDGFGITFGWSTNDVDNTPVSREVVDSPLTSGVPATIIIDANHTGSMTVHQAGNITSTNLWYYARELDPDA